MDVPPRLLKILLPTIGSFGDVHPVIAIAQGLRARGHRAVLVANEVYRDVARDAGIDFLPMGTVAEGEAAIADPDLWHPRRGFQAVMKHAVLPNIGRLYEIVEREAGPDTVVAASVLCFGARIAHEKFGIPLASLHLQPSVIRSISDPGKPGPGLAFPAWLPRFLVRGFFNLADFAVLDRVLAPAINAFREKLGLSPVKHILENWVHSPQLVIALFPEWFARPQPDWPANTHAVGFVQYDRAENPLPKEAEEFLRGGTPPVVFTYGSAGAHMHELFEESIKSAERLDLRAMLVTRYPEQLPSRLPPSVRHFEYLPFSQILPRASALVHHGGIGTMAQAIKGGIPQIIVPHGHDQPDNANRIEKLRLGTWIDPRQYRGARLDRALTSTLADASMRARCAQYSATIDSTVSVERTCDLIEALGSQAARPDAIRVQAR